MNNKIWDDTLKRLITANPQHFVSWVMKGATFKNYLATELRGEKREADIVLEVELAGEEVLLQIEFQSTMDNNMAQRLLEYNVLAKLEHQRFILSCVIYLRKGKNIPESPLVWSLPDGRTILVFYYLVIKLWEIPAEDILEMGLVGLFPLLPLAQGGRSDKIIDRMIDGIVAINDYNLLSLGKIIAGLAYKGKIDQEVLKRRFAMFGDILEESWVYQEIVEKGMKKGIEKGIEKGMAEGIAQQRQQELQRQSKAILAIVHGRFPRVVKLVEKRIRDIAEPEVLQTLLVRISLAQNEQEIYQHLLELNDEKAAD